MAARCTAAGMSVGIHFVTVDTHEHTHKYTHSLQYYELRTLCSYAHTRIPAYAHANPPGKQVGVDRCVQVGFFSRGMRIYRHVNS